MFKILENIYKHPHFVGLREGLYTFFNSSLFPVIPALKFINLKNLFIMALFISVLTNPLVPAVSLGVSVFVSCAALITKWTAIVLGLEMAVNLVFNSYSPQQREDRSNLLVASLHAGKLAANRAAADRQDSENSAHETSSYQIPSISRPLHENYHVGDELSRHNIVDAVDKLLSHNPQVEQEVRATVSNGVFFLRTQAQQAAVDVSKAAKGAWNSLPGLSRR